MAEDNVDEELLDEDGEGPEDLEDAEIEDMPDDDLLDDGLDVAAEVDLPEIDGVVAPVAPVVAPAASDDDDEEEEDDEADEDDVEASLDVILKEKLVVADDEDTEEVADQEDRVETTTKVLPKQPDEFSCQSCFLVKHPSQLADAERQLCRDCV